MTTPPGIRMLLLGISFLAIGHAAEPPAESVAEPVIGTGIFPAAARTGFGDDELLIPEIFASHLPTTLSKYALRLWLNPHIGDFRNRDHLRLTTGMRYGLTENWQISVASDFFFSHGYGEVESFERIGAANLQLGTKVNLGQPWFRGWDVGAGIDVLLPMGEPPAELTDGLRHFMPYLTLSHRLKKHPDLRIFFGLRVDELGYTSLAGEFGKNAFRESSSGITGGWVIDRKNWHYTFEAAYDTTRLMGHSSKDVFSIRPGVIWEIPSRRDPQAKGRWVVGIALKSAFGPGGTSLGASLKLRYNRDLKKAPRPVGAPTP